MNRPLVTPSKLFMKAKLLSALGLSIVLFLAASAAAQKREPPASPPPPDTTPPPVAIAPAPPGGAPVYVYEQKPLGGQQPLVGPQQAQAIIDRFKAAYPKLGNPRLLIYVNRELVDENSGLKLVARTEKIQTTSKGDAANSTKTPRMRTVIVCTNERNRSWRTNRPFATSNGSLGARCDWAVSASPTSASLLN